ncbi:MAG: glycosyltransferase [Lewinellaceae bacterium]|nr:glycosyltransferase [Lewinellaceae bacterium]
MKLLLTADPMLPVPPKEYGGIERIIDGLITEYANLGHEVIILAHPKSTAKQASKIIGWKGLQVNSKVDILKNGLQLRKVYKKEKPDIVHSFSRLLYLYPLFRTTRARVVQSYQRDINPITTRRAAKLAKGKLTFTACASHMYQSLPEPEKWHAIHNFTNTDFFRDDPARSKDYLFFLGRIEEIKGAYEAIQVARATGEELILAGNIEKAQIPYFETKVKPYIDGKQIRYVGLVDDTQKRQWLQGAKALLFPIKWEEPFGIVMAEALACGTPVIAFNRGSVPEVIEQGKTGWIAEDLEEMIQAVSSLDQIDRLWCCQTAKKRFSAEIIALQYLQLYADHAGSKR